MFAIRIWAVVAALTPTLLSAQTLPASLTAAIDKKIAEDMSAQHIPGLSLGIVRNGKLIYSKGYGLANVELDVPATPETVYKIGSVSKQFLASDIMLLVQDGKLSVDDPISKHVPGTPASWSGITVRHFLDHTSGVIREGPAFDALKVQPDSVVIASAFDAPLVFPTGTKWQYCNVCYFTLADIVRRLSGQSWAEFTTARIFKPAGMVDSRTTTSSDLVRRRASGYVWRDGGFVPAPVYLALRPSGAFLSTIKDLAKWDSILSAGSIITQASWDQMATPSKFKDGSTVIMNPRDSTASYGFGWMTSKVDGHRQVEHGGALPGFRAQMSRYPDDRLSIIILTNGDGAVPGRIEQNVAKIIFGAK